MTELTNLYQPNIYLNVPDQTFRCSNRIESDARGISVVSHIYIYK